MKYVRNIRLSMHKEIKENIKIYVTCIGQDSNPIPPCKQTPNLTIVLTYHKWSKYRFNRYKTYIYAYFYKKVNHALLECVKTLSGSKTQANYSCTSSVHEHYI